jgi:site-specific recombinase XerD
MGKTLQTTGRNNYELVKLQVDEKSSLKKWLDLYFHLGDISSENSRKVKRRDLEVFIEFMEITIQSDEIELWSPRISKMYLDELKKTLKNEKRRWSDRTINRMLAHLKTFSKWIHKHQPFRLGDPTKEIKAIPTTTLLDVERAITKKERARILDAADDLVENGGRSVDRNRYKKKDTPRPRRKSFRPIRNRAIVYLLMETGMRRAASVNLKVGNILEKERKVRVNEKGDVQHSYTISKEGLKAVLDYLNSEEYKTDYKKWKIDTLFLTPSTCGHGNGQMRPTAINEIWNQVCKKAEVEGRTPHSARHAMGKHILEKTGNLEAVQRQLNHKNPTYSMQYARITSEELKTVLDDR